MVLDNDWALGLLSALTGNLNLLPVTSIALILLMAIWRRAWHGKWPEIFDSVALTGIVLSAYNGAVVFWFW